MKQLLMIFLAVCTLTLHTVLSAETIPKNASGIIIWGNTPKTEKISDEPLDALYKKYKVALFVPADKITAYYWEEQVFSLPWSYVYSVMEDLYEESSQTPSFFHS